MSAPRFVTILAVIVAAGALLAQVEGGVARLESRPSPPPGTQPALTLQPKDTQAIPPEPKGVSRVAPMAVDDPRGARRLALCIGIDDYDPKSGCPKLSCAVADAKELARALAALGFETTVMVDDAQSPDLRPTYRNLDDQVFKFARQATDPNTTLVVTYSGHGDTVGDQTGLVPLDYDQSEGRLFLLSQLLGHLGQSKWKRALKTEPG